MSKGKPKGNRYERIVANILSEKFEGYKGIQIPFRRNPDSGAFFGGTNIERTEIYDTEWAHYGDLICPRNFKFSIECKHYKSPPTFAAIFKGHISEWDTWLEKAERDAVASEKEMLLVVRYNYIGDLAFFRKGFYKGDIIMPYKEHEVFRFNDVLEENEDFFFMEEEK